MSLQQFNQSNDDQELELSEQDKALFYPVLLFRQFARMISSLGAALILCAACYAEIDQLGKQWFGDNGDWLSLAFVMLLATSIRFIYTLAEDFIDEVKSGKRLQNTYTLIVSIGTLMGVASLFQFQMRLVQEEGSLSIFKVLWQLIF
ncbi:MAG: hypothetical protein OQK12_07400 [Motiliproteus sp.]|nr:hypothetical protein [Motiliproteus sp.]MCW9053851.1 hypothetical protein [Motiliproteus sp.]